MLKFLRPTLIVVGVYLLALLVGRSISPARHTQRADARDEMAADVEVGRILVSSLLHPEPKLRPEDVVRIQLHAMADPDPTRGTLQCMWFASPANRTVTGPLSNFGQLIRTPPYDVLASAEATLVGAAQFEDNEANVLVTAFYRRRPYAFIWVLSRQTEDPFTACWMTDAVIPVSMKGKEAEAPGEA